MTMMPQGNMPFPVRLKARKWTFLVVIDIFI